MISIEKCRKLLETDKEKFTDDEIIRIREQLYKIAELSIDDYFEKHMKTLKFKPHLVEKILSGEKTSTWRLFDDKDLKIGDELTFINQETGKEFGKAKITHLKVKTLGTLTDDDWQGHERYSSDEEMYKHYREYYGDKVSPNSELKIIDFDFELK